jgi:hypothetical protein
LRLQGIVAVTAGLTHSLALDGAGALWAWGYNGRGGLGDGTTADSPWPNPVGGLGAVTDSAGGEFHSVAVLADGYVWAWGGNNYCQLGNGSLEDSPVPVMVDFGDAVPPDQGNVLRGARQGPDVRLEFAAAPAQRWRVYRDGDKRSIGRTAVPPDATGTTFLDADPPAPSFYYLRGLSACSSTPGP